MQKEETPEEAMAKLKAKGKKELAVVDHNKIEYLDFKKDFYREVPEITKMTDEEVEAYREEMESIKIKGKVNGVNQIMNDAKLLFNFERQERRDFAS